MERGVGFDCIYGGHGSNAAQSKENVMLLDDVSPYDDSLPVCQTKDCDSIESVEECPDCGYLACYWHQEQHYMDEHVR